MLIIELGFPLKLDSQMYVNCNAINDRDDLIFLMRDGS